MLTSKKGVYQVRDEARIICGYNTYKALKPTWGTQKSSCGYRINTQEKTDDPWEEDKSRMKGLVDQSANSLWDDNAVRWTFLHAVEKATLQAMSLYRANVWATTSQINHEMMAYGMRTGDVRTQELKSSIIPNAMDVRMRKKQWSTRAASSFWFVLIEEKIGSLTEKGTQKNLRGEESSDKSQTFLGREASWELWDRKIIGQLSNLCKESVQ